MFSSVIGLLGEFFKVRKKNHIAAGTCINNGNINVAKTIKNDLWRRHEEQTESRDNKEKRKTSFPI